MQRIACAVLAAAALTGHAGAQPAKAATSIAGEWSGRYICAQGVTGVTLTITEKPGGAITAVFAFGPVKENVLVPKGAYSMSGRFDERAGRVTLKQVKWIEAPSGYVMVDLTGDLRDQGRTIRGAIDGPGCSDFEVHRTDPKIG